MGSQIISAIDLYESFTSSAEVGKRIQMLLKVIERIVQGPFNYDVFSNWREQKNKYLTDVALQRK